MRTDRQTWPALFAFVSCTSCKERTTFLSFLTTPQDGLQVLDAGALDLDPVSQRKQGNCDYSLFSVAHNGPLFLYTQRRLILKYRRQNIRTFMLLNSTVSGGGIAHHVTGWTTAVWSLSGVGIVSFPTMSRQALRPTQPPVDRRVKLVLRLRIRGALPPHLHTS
jgi:hypothetical protein